MRGKAYNRKGHRAFAGITPAYAGKSFRILSANQEHKDHPRLCGEKLSFTCSFNLRKRITPAYAGKSRTSN